MRSRLGVLFAVFAGLVFCLGADKAVTGSKKFFLVYSSDERLELAPCG